VRIVQVLLSGATGFEHKCQRVDFEALRIEHQVELVTDARDAGNGGVAHYYGGGKQTIVKIGPRKRWFSARPTVAISPLQEHGFSFVPESVEETYFEKDEGGGMRDEAVRAVGVLKRSPIVRLLELTIARVHRTRDDVDFLVFDEPPSPEELTQVDVWLDPAADERDFDGFVAEAIVSGLPVVASRTPINVQRLEKGRIGFLAPPNDPNELAHAILSALFKPEVAQQKIDGARQTKSKFRSRQRLRVLVPIYESLLS
jgi:hypothetical protein